MAKITPIKPPEESTPVSRETPILNWYLAIDETDPHRVAQAASAGATLASLVVQAIQLGGDKTRVPDDDLAEALLVEIARFNACACQRLSSLLAGRE